MHGQADRPHRALLCARELRAVHAVPRRDCVDHADSRAHRARSGRHGGSGYPAGALHEHDGHHHLRAQRFLRRSHCLRTQEVPRRIRSTHQRQTVPNGRHGRGIMADTTRVTLTIEGQQVDVPAGTSILEAARLAGVLVPHYCYHPGLPIAGNCRMCLVEVEKSPKLVPSCATAAAEGQVVHVFSERTLEQRQGVLEFLLLNHPLDCPICAKSGECELQDYTYREGRPQGRSLDPKRFNPAEDFGGDVLYVTNRCILCTRCVRFMSDVAQDTALNVSERGDRAVVGKADGRDLTHPWAANVIDLCPVGALLSKDFLHKVRAWELDRAPSICPNCTQGCNTIVETRDNAVVRMRPRTNLDVNHYYLCDQGRLDYRWMN